MTIPESTPRDDTEGVRKRVREAISGAWSTMPTCWEAQTNAVLAALPGDLSDRMNDPVEEIAWDLRELIGPQLDEAQVRDADGVAALVADIVSPVLERLRAERDEAQKRADWLRGHAEWLSNERDALKAAVLDVDAHATPFGDIPEDPGYVGTYLVTAGALHRALGKIGHTAPKCQAEAAVERGRRAAEKWRTDLKANERESWAITARHVCAEILAALEGNETDGTAND